MDIFAFIGFSLMWAVVIVTAFTPEEWKRILDQIEE